MIEVDLNHAEIKESLLALPSFARLDSLRLQLSRAVVDVTNLRTCFIELAGRLTSLYVDLVGDKRVPLVALLLGPIGVLKKLKRLSLIGVGERCLGCVTCCEEDETYERRTRGDIRYKGLDFAPLTSLPELESFILRPCETDEYVGCSLKQGQALGKCPALTSWVSAYKYLGVELGCGPGHLYRHFRLRMLPAARRAAGHIAGMGMYSGKLPVPLGVRVYQALVRPLLEYAAEVTSLTAWPEADRLQITIGKRILQCSSKTTDETVIGELGWPSMEARYQQLRLGFWGKLQQMPADAPARLVYQATLQYHACHATAADGVPSASAVEGWSIYRLHEPTLVSTLWCAQLQRDLFTTGLESFWNDPGLIMHGGAESAQSAWLHRVKVVVNTREQARWWKAAQQRPILRTYVTLKEQTRLQREAYLSVPHGGWNDRIRLGRCVLTRLRTGTNELRINTGRWERLPVAARLCELCAAAVEDERHFLLDCRFFADERRALYTSIDRLVNDAERLTRVDGAIGLHEPPFDCASLPASARLIILTGGRDARIASAAVELPVLSALLIALAQWMRRRKEHFALLERFRVESSSPDSSSDSESASVTSGDDLTDEDEWTDSPRA